MELFKEWISAITSAIIFASLCEILLPSGNMKKYVNLILGIILSITMLRPFADNSFNKWPDKLLEFERVSAYASQEELDKEERYMVIKIYTEKIEKTLYNKLCENIKGEVFVNIEVETDNKENFGEINKATIIVVQKDGFKDYRKEIEEILKSEFGIKDENIIIIFKST